MADTKRVIYLNDLTEDERCLILALRNPDVEMKQRLSELMNSDNPIISEGAKLCIKIANRGECKRSLMTGD